MPANIIPQPISPLGTWHARQLKVNGSRIACRVAPQASPLEDQLVRWIQDDFKTLQEFRRSRHAIVYRITEPDPDKSLYLKLFLPRDCWERYKALIRPSRARRTLQANRTLTGLGFQTKDIIGLAEYRRYGMITQSLLVSRALPGIHEVRSVLREPDHGFRNNSQARRALIRQLGAELGAWHKAGLYHGDLRLSNLMVRFDAGISRFFWMDNERTRRFRALPRTRRLRNLVQVIMDPGVFSRTDMMRLWLSYKEAAEFHDPNEKDFLRTVIRRTRERQHQRNWR